MFECRITIDAPALAESIYALAEAIKSKTTSTVESPAPAAPVISAPVAPEPVAPVVSYDTTVPAAAASPFSNMPPVSAPIPAPMAAAPVPAPVPAPIPVSIPVASAPAATETPLTQDMLANAGARLLEKGMMAQLMGLLNTFGVQSVTALQPSQYPAFAAGLRQLGATGI